MAAFSQLVCNCRFACETQPNQAQLVGSCRFRRDEEPRAGAPPETSAAWLHTNRGSLPPATCAKAPTRASTSASRFLLDQERVTTSAVASLTSRRAVIPVGHGRSGALHRRSSYVLPQAERAAWYRPQGSRAPQASGCRGSGRRLVGAQVQVRLQLPGATRLDTALIHIPLAPCITQAANWLM